MKSDEECHGETAHIKGAKEISENLKKLWKLQQIL